MVLKVVTGKILETLELWWFLTARDSVLGLRVEIAREQSLSPSRGLIEFSGWELRPLVGLSKIDIIL
jgi:hypothetical protein